MTTLMPLKIGKDDLLYHPVHGLCRTDKVIEQNKGGKKVFYYSLLPTTRNKMKIRFVVPAADVVASGFHKLISVKEAKEILGYLHDGDINAAQKSQTWTLAQNILSFSADTLKTKDQRRRQLLEHSVRGLVIELSVVFNITLKEAAARVQKSLGKKSKINLLVLAALGRVVQD